MHKTTTTVLLLASLFAAAPVMAAGGHDHGPGGSHSQGPISSDAVIKKAGKQVQALIGRGKIDKSWADVKAVGATQKAYEKGTEWVVAFKNDKVSDAAKQTLYVFYTLEGIYIATNFTGQ